VEGSAYLLLMLILILYVVRGPISHSRGARAVRARVLSLSLVCVALSLTAYRTPHFWLGSCTPHRHTSHFIYIYATLNRLKSTVISANYFLFILSIILYYYI